MTPKEFADKLRKQLEEFKRVNKPFQLAVYDAVGRVSKRAFEEGKDTDGNRYQYANSWYKQYRKKKGRETAFVNWRFRSDLKSDYENSPKPDENGNYTRNEDAAFKVSPQRYQSRLVRQENVDKYRFLTERFGIFLDLNKEEEAQFYKDLEFETRKFFAL